MSGTGYDSPCPKCGANKEIDTEAIKWKGLLFCSESCLDACRAAQ